MNRTRSVVVLLTAFIYIAVGILTAALSRSADSAQLRTFSRLAAWALSFAVFGGHVFEERVRARASTRQAALRAAGAVALATFALALWGPVRSHWDAPDFWRAAALSAPLWPVLTGVASFIVALALGSLLGRRDAHQ